MGEFKTSLKVLKLDMYPAGGGVEYHPLNGVTPFSDEPVDCVLYACSFPHPPYQTEPMRLAIATLRPGGLLVVTDVHGRVAPSMDAAHALA